MSLDVIPLSTSAYLGDTQHFSLAQHGAYMLLLMAMWRHGGWIDDDEVKLARLCKLPRNKFRATFQAIRDKLICRDGKLSQKRLLEEVEHATAKAETNRQNGAMGGRPSRVPGSGAKNAPEDGAKSLKNIAAEKANGYVWVSDGQSGDSIDSIFSKDSKKERGIQERELNLESESVAARAKPKCKHRLPANWEPGPSGYRYAEQNGYGRAEAEHMFEAFRIHHTGRGTTWLKWEMAWQQWVRNERKWHPKSKFGGTNAKTSAVDRAIALAKKQREDELAEGHGRPPEPSGGYGDRGEIVIAFPERQRHA